jgi:hypothetical protein
MGTLDDLAFRWLGPGANGIHLIAGALLLLLVPLLSFLAFLHVRMRSSVKVPPEEPKTCFPFGRATIGQPRTEDREPPSLAEKPARDGDHHVDLDDPFIHGGSYERRSSWRRHGNPLAIYVVEGADMEAVEKGWVVDRSANGLCLEMEREVAVETILKIRPTNAHITTPWVEVQVRNCRLNGSWYQVGCQFVRHPSSDIILAFG